MERELFSAPFLWEALKAEKRPIALYGMGNGAKKILDICQKLGIVISEIFASDDFVRGQIFNGYKVKTLSQIQQEYTDFVVLLAFGTAREDVLENIYEIEKNHVLYLPDVPVCGENIFTREFLKENLGDIMTVYNMLEDELSKETYKSILLYKITGKLKYLLENIVSREKMLELFDFGKDEVYIDAGAYHGDTVEEFIKLTGGYKEIIAVEPDAYNFRRLCKNTAHQENVKALNIGLWSRKGTVFFPQKSGRGGGVDTGEANTEVDTVDNIAKIPPTYIKYDVEGGEKEALMGSVGTIKKYRPQLMVSIYHRTEDLFALPLQIKDIEPCYKFYIRRNPGVPAWDINLIGLIDKE